MTAGQTIVVLEAMKMENELRAPRAGTLSELRCTEGAPVEAGQDLATIA
ncbi:MAG TPA: acetyl-CoA carboxylase biotin carboxyl carrier protein subunit [Polyangia bacterium]|nr:acetyl-CoA carboxylase biotin carboxyl carrier protein subunit [Polyangia bacterium]